MGWLFCFFFPSPSIPSLSLFLGNGLLIREEAAQKRLPGVLISGKMRLPLNSAGREEEGGESRWMDGLNVCQDGANNSSSLGTPVEMLGQAGVKAPMVLLLGKVLMCAEKKNGEVWFERFFYCWSSFSSSCW